MELKELIKGQERNSKQLEECFAMIASNIADTIVEGDQHPSQMLPKKVLKEKAQHEIQEGLITIKRRMENGVSQLLRAVLEFSRSHQDIHLDTIGQDLSKLIVYLASLPDHAREYFAGMNNDISLQELCKMSNDTLDVLYKGAKHLYEQQRYQEAADAFSILTFLNAKHHPFWMGLGNSEYFCHRYQAALVAFAMAAIINPSDPYCHIFSCKCYEETKEIDNAINALDLALLTIGDDKNYAALKDAVTVERRKIIQKNKKLGD